MSLNGDPTPHRISEFDLHAFVDGVLDDSRRDELLAYLAAHPLEAEKVNAYFRQRVALEQLRDALTNDDDAEFAPQLQRKLEHALLRQKLFRGVTRMAAGIAVLAPLALAGWWAMADRGEPQAVVAEAEATARTEETFSPVFPFGGTFGSVTAVTAAVDPTASPLAILNSYLEGTNLQVPDLAAYGLTLVGGSVVDHVDPPAARLVYQDEAANLVVVYIGLAAGTAPQAVTFVPEGHMSVSWRSGSLVLSIVGPVDSPQLYEVMRAVTRDVTTIASAPEAVTPVIGESPAAVEPTVLPEASPPADGGSTPVLETTPISNETPRVL